MNLRTAMDRLIIVQAGLTISDPVTMTIEKAHKFVPPMSEAMPDLPAWTNSFTLTSIDYGVSGQRTTVYTVHSQLFIARGVDDVGADAAASFLDAFITAMEGQSQLVDGAGVPTIVEHTIRGGNPTLVSMSRANLPHIGLDLFIDLKLEDAVTLS